MQLPNLTYVRTFRSWIELNTGRPATYMYVAFLLIPTKHLAYIYTWGCTFGIANLLITIYNLIRQQYQSSSRDCMFIFFGQSIIKFRGAHGLDQYGSIEILQLDHSEVRFYKREHGHYIYVFNLYSRSKTRDRVFYPADQRCSTLLTSKQFSFSFCKP